MNVDIPKVSVVMPVYKGDNYLSEAVDSILNQTFSDFEFIIICDDPTDKTRGILDKYKQEDSRMKIYYQERQGLVNSLNRSFSLAQGEYIARMDADDISRPERLEKQLDHLANPQTDFVCSWIDIINETGEIIDHIADISSSEEIYYTLNFRNCIAHGSIMFRKNIIDVIGSYDESCAAEDYHLWHRVSKKYIIHKIDVPLYAWRTHETSISSVNYNRLSEAVYKIFRDNFTQLLGRDIEDKLTRLMWDNFCNTHYADLNNYSRQELLTIAKLIRKLNAAIVDNAPPDLSKRSINELGNEKYIRYLAVAGRKIGVLKTLELINEIDESDLDKIAIIRRLAGNLIRNRKNTTKNY
ncbi:glycosyltransferase family 2 protein [Methanosarcina sp. UBA5]|uniref:glycosyltransferase family 2 protein n=1 Tax=Methanosarcina sp. UBA5 TaxID=1915593 RepID=UPI0025EC3D20|nr:glycosyltransferase [Methanosarcina sp. UBA5]